MVLSCGASGNQGVVCHYNDTTQKLTVTVSQAQSDSVFNYDLPLKAALIYGNDKTIIDWHIDKRKDTFTYAYKGGQRPVLVPDCEHIMPGEMKDTKKPLQYIAQFMQSDDYVSKRLAVATAGRLMSDSASQVIIDLALSDSMKSIRRYALSQLKNSQNEKYHKRWNAKVLAMATNETDNETRAEAFDVLGEWKTAAGKQQMLSVLYDSSYDVAGNALAAINKLDKDTAYVLAKQLLKTEPRSTLESSVWNIIGKKGADEDIALYEKRVPYVLGTKKFTFAFSLNNYLKSVKSDASFSKGIDLYTAMIITENMKMYRSGMEGFMIQVANDQKGNAKSDKPEEAATAKARLAVVKTALDKIAAAEKDPDNKKELEKSMKDTFE